jgi:hypothetical protein
MIVCITPPWRSGTLAIWPEIVALNQLIGSDWRKLDNVGKRAALGVLQWVSIRIGIQVDRGISYSSMILRNPFLNSARSEDEIIFGLKARSAVALIMSLKMRPRMTGWMLGVGSSIMLRIILII